ncbi:hypothetical protein B0W47_16580 (plasmid) [Komagataeibacter nataicola]|uniref:Uncharacterized protein n=2 Tax=Komagataeibacter nataicola TaxID=265960 RepID=A0A9N7CNX1_9PROT|nr:hypothetical protein [Komagataeibacter nataicola]AQU89198.1 hypothetical protein B0W47_16580 [Komagataeibacter nataicola]PYD66288.1 hypothetical protein CDI09_09070 [Komagataeibacter nataicola]WNM10321.1 hypothetical protein RI056_18650 [Komagataeibacter nataicola]GBR23332.1 hypothetical protein AA0616_2494 [Komagataeibacter nataicola NRIC 0616]
MMKYYIYEDTMTHEQFTIHTNDNNFARYSIMNFISDDNIGSFRKQAYIVMTIYFAIAMALFGYTGYELVYNLWTGHDTLDEAKQALQGIPSSIGSMSPFMLVLIAIVGFSLFKRLIESTCLLMCGLVAALLSSMGLLWPLVHLVANYPVMMPAIMFLILSANKSATLFYLTTRRIDFNAWFKSGEWFPVTIPLKIMKFRKELKRKQQLAIEYDEFAFVKGRR